MSKVKLEGSLSATGSSSWVSIYRGFNVTLSGTWSGSVDIERSFDGGTTPHIVSKDVDGNAATYSANVSIAGFEEELNVLYRITFTRVSGTVDYRISG